MTCLDDLLVSLPDDLLMMRRLHAVYGEWLLKDCRWDFVVDNVKGARIIFLGEAEMMQDPNTPHIHVTSDRQVRNLLEITKTHGVRLCVSSRSKVETVSEFREDDDEADECFEDDDDDLEDDGEEDDGEEDDGEEDVDISIVAEADENGEDYSVYGNVENEDEEDDDMCFEDTKNIEGGRSNCNNIYVNQSFISKDALLSELWLTAVRLRFSFRIYKSTKTLLVTTCPVSGCQWKVRASVKHGTNTFGLFIDRVGIIDGWNPQHITDAMKNMFGMTLDYTTSYRALLYAQTLTPLEITKTHGVRLCVSSRSKVEMVSEFREEDDEADECFEDDDDDLFEDENHDGDEDDGEEDDGEEDDGEEDDADISIVAEADENDDASVTCSVWRMVVE
ncbi:hypothetical protein F2Q70_00029865 [Brassica cretica]|uniref:Transposase MuDR plant domain-containing protein n=1 Tax=Brassica cretica TaxID=69181 RepID=A0A8S9FDV3_BRACR|nr:hypothetical protein F2Q70_00029865 [Brassica cretica]